MSDFPSFLRDDRAPASPPWRLSEALTRPWLVGHQRPVWYEFEHGLRGRKIPTEGETGS